MIQDLRSTTKKKGKMKKACLEVFQTFIGAIVPLLIFRSQFYYDRRSSPSWSSTIPISIRVSWRCRLSLRPCGWMETWPSVTRWYIMISEWSKTIGFQPNRHLHLRPKVLTTHGYLLDHQEYLSSSNRPSVGKVLMIHLPSERHLLIGPKTMSLEGSAWLIDRSLVIDRS